MQLLSDSWGSFRPHRYRWTINERRKKTKKHHEHTEQLQYSLTQILQVCKSPHHSSLIWCFYDGRIIRYDLLMDNGHRKTCGITLTMLSQDVKWQTELLYTLLKNFSKKNECSIITELESRGNRHSFAERRKGWGNSQPSSKICLPTPLKLITFHVSFIPNCLNGLLIGIAADQQPGTFPKILNRLSPSCG